MTMFGLMGVDILGPNWLKLTPNGVGHNFQLKSEACDEANLDVVIDNWLFMVKQVTSKLSLIIMKLSSFFPVWLHSHL